MDKILAFFDRLFGGKDDITRAIEQLADQGRAVLQGLEDQVTDLEASAKELVEQSVVIAQRIEELNEQGNLANEYADKFAKVAENLKGLLS